MTKTQLATSQAVHLPDRATIAWQEPRPVLSGSTTWTVALTIDSWPNGVHQMTFFGTEEQVRAIIFAGPTVKDHADPAQLDALEVAQ